MCSVNIGGEYMVEINVRVNLLEDRKEFDVYSFKSDFNNDVDMKNVKSKITRIIDAMMEDSIESRFS